MGSKTNKKFYYEFKQMVVDLYRSSNLVKYLSSEYGAEVTIYKLSTNGLNDILKWIWKTELPLHLTISIS